MNLMERCCSLLLNNNTFYLSVASAEGRRTLPHEVTKQFRALKDSV